MVARILCAVVLCCVTAGTAQATSWMSKVSGDIFDPVNIPISSLPFVQNVQVTGENDSYALSDSLFSFKFQQQPSGNADGMITFTPILDLHYEVSGTYTMSPPGNNSGTLLQFAQLIDNSNPNSFLGRVFYNENENNGPGSTWSFTLGIAQGIDTHDVEGNLAGTLHGGRPYTLTYRYSATNMASGDLTAHFSLLGDLNGDRSIGFDDLVILARSYGATSATYQMGDIDGDGVVGFNDLVFLARNYGLAFPATSDAAAIVPEPQSVGALLLLAGLLLQRQKYCTRHRHPQAG